MRKSIFFITIVMLIALLGSCSKEEAMNVSGKSGNVCILAELPEAIVPTRAQITIGADHKLRCILEVWSREETPALKYRQEVAVAVGVTPAFNFTLESGDYSCLIWADFIKANTSVAKVTGDGFDYNHYEDTYYNTSDLRNITIKDEKGTNLFDTDNCDAYFSTQELVKQEEESPAISFKLERPFAKLIVKEQDAKSFANLKKMNVYYSIPKGFNVAMGEPTDEAVTVAYEKTFQEDDSQVLFTHYIFAPAVGTKALGTVALALTTASKRNCSIPEGSITLKRNQRTNASGKLIAGGSIDPEPEPEPDEDKDPQVGDYFFIDGTWGPELTAENKGNCVGVVYAVGAKTGDENSAYGENKKVRGYVMALKNIPVSDLDASAGMSGNRPYFYKHNNKLIQDEVTVFPCPSSPDIINYNGYAKTQEYLNSESFKSHSTDWHYPALQCLNTWRNGLARKTVNASEWYIPSFNQLISVIGGCYGYEGNGKDYLAVPKADALSKAFTAAIEAKIAEVFNARTDKAFYILSSSLHGDAEAKSTAPMAVQVTGLGTDVKPIKSVNTMQGYVRPVLTILK